MNTRTSKIWLVLAMSFYCLLAVFGNITDWAANFPAVTRALEMKDIFPNSTISYRAITSPILQQLAFIIIVCSEALTGLLCAFGAWQLFHARKEPQLFNQNKKWAIAGLTLGFLTWNVLFMSIGGEWFGIWMSPVLNSAIGAAFQIFITMLAVLIYVVHKDK
ncbi:MAG: DUF2165 domain-containing protein [Legionella sp.]|nr:MAG: DUF2165 domain-containing protein [Legionella sp.]